MNNYKVLKLKVITGLFLILLGMPAIAGYGDTLMSNRKFSLYYDVSERTITLKLKSSSFRHKSSFRSSSRKTIEYPVQTTDEVKKALVDIKAFLKDEKKEYQDEAYAYLEKLYYLNGTEEKVMHFKNRDSSTEQLSLVDQVKWRDQVSQFDDKSYWSIPLIEITSKELGRNIQLRAVLNEDEGIEKFSFVDPNKSLEKYYLEMTGDLIGLRDNKNLFFVLKVNKVNENYFTMTLLSPREISHLDDVTRVHYSLRREDKKWSFSKYSSSEKEAVGSYSEIALTDISVEHELVARIQGSDDFIKSIDEEGLRDELTKSFSSIYSSEQIDESLESSKRYYNKCMIERHLININEKLGHEEDHLYKSCLNFVKLNIAYDLAIQSEYSDKSLLAGLKGCYVKSTLVQVNNFFSQVSYPGLDYLTKNKKADSAIKSCLLTHKLNEGRKKVASEFIKDSNLSDVMKSDQQAMDLLIKSTLEKGYDYCLSNYKGEDIQTCSNFSKVSLQTELFQAEFSRMIQNLDAVSNKEQKESYKEISQAFSQCKAKVESEAKATLKSKFSKAELEASSESLMKCVRVGLFKLKESSPPTEIYQALLKIEFIKSNDLDLDDDYVARVDNRMNTCIEDELEESSEVITLLQDYDEIKLRCSLYAIVRNIHQAYETYVRDFIVAEYIDNKEEQERISKTLSRNLKKIIKNANSFDELNELIEKDEIFSAATSVNFAISNFFDRYFSLEGEDLVYRFNSESRDEIYLKSKKLIGFNDNSPIKLNLIEYINKAVAKEGYKAVSVYSKDFLRNVAKEAVSFMLVRDISPFIQDEEEKKIAVGNIEDEIITCLISYNPNKDETKVYDAVNNCMNKGEARRKFLLAKKEFEKIASHHFLLTSMEANQSLSPLHAMKACIDTAQERIQDRDLLMKWIEACQTVSYLDFGEKLMLKKVEKFQPILSGAGGRYAGPVAAYCFAIMDMDIAKVLDNPDLNQALRMRDRHFKTERNTLVRSIANSKELNFEWMKKKVDKCFNDTEQMIMTGMREHILQKIPAIYNQGTNRTGETNEDVLRKYIDLEFVELLSKIQVASQPEGGELNSSKLPKDMIVTSKLTTEMIKNGSRLIGSYLSSGFFFDKDGMKTQLMIFMAEAKEAMRDILKGKNIYTIDDLSVFFKESTLGDHVALAVISERVYWKFLGFLRTMELEEHRKKGSDERKRINNKYARLRNLAKQMTSSREFVRIINPSPDTDGEVVLKYIKNNFLLPKVVGKKISANNLKYIESKIDRDVGSLIIADDSNGGFSEKFVAEMAQHHLSLQEEDKWWITKFLFYDDGDFNWTKIRNTKSGAKAIRYYGKNILLPKIMGRTLSDYSVKYRMDKFLEYIEEAQDEFDD